MKTYSRTSVSRGVRARRMLIVACVLAVPALAATLSHAVVPPLILSGVTKDTGNGQLDRIEVTFDSPMNPASMPKKSSGPGDPGFYLGDGYAIDHFTWDSANVLSIHLVEKATPDTGVKPSVTYVGGGGGAQLALFPTVEAETGSPQQIIDGAGPVLLAVAAKDLPVTPGLFNANGEEISFTFSEPTLIAGQTKIDRWSNLEKAIRFESVPTEGGTCPVDGDGGLQNYNFPQPNAAIADSADAIDEPAIGQSATTFKISRKTTSIQANYKLFPGIPRGCWVGIDPAAANQSLLTDAANNAAKGMNLPEGTGQKVRINPVDGALVSAKTADGRVGAPDGFIDAINLTFDQKIDDETIEEQLSRISISLDGLNAIVDTDSVDTGATENDASFFVPFTLPNNVKWDGGARPSVSYVKPADCTPTSGNGLKAIVPTGGTWRACIASFSVPASDGAGPALLDSKTLDATANGRIDGVLATFSEDIISGKPNGWTLDARTATAFTIDSTNPKRATITFNEGSIGDTGERPVLAYASQALANATTDAAGIEVLVVTGSVKKDGAAPRIVTATEYDLDGDGNVERAVVEYSEAILDPASAGPFSVGGTSATFAAPADGDDDPDVADDRFVSLAIAGLTGTESKELVFASGTPKVKDAAANEALAQTILAANVIDKAAPRGTVSIAPGAPMKAGTSTVTVTFSENMATAAAPPTKTLAGRDLTPKTDADHTNGWVSADHRIWEGTIDIVQSDCPIATGCTVTATIDGASDVAAPANAQAVPATKQTMIDTIAPQAPVLGPFAATLEAGETAPADVINMFTNAFSVDATVVAGDAAGGKAQILVDGLALATPALDSTIGAGDTSVAPATAFATGADLRTAIAEGAHALTVQLCDTAENCTPSATSISVTSDYTPVSVELGAPQGGNVVAGGSSLDVTWNGDDAGEGFDHVDLQYSIDGGSTFGESIAAGLLDRDGTHSWTVPSIETAAAKVRVAAVDVNGNKGLDASDATFAIDSVAPVVTVISPAASSPFVKAGGTHTVRWSVADATVDRVTDPITIEFSSNNGSTWSPINGGSYSKADDGVETWRVPSGDSFTTLLRVTAKDATEKIGSKVSTKLAKGVAGYVADRGGRIYAFGTATTTTNETRVSSSDIIRGLVLRSTGTRGFVVDYRGRLYGFSLGSASKPSIPKFTTFSGDSARGIVLRTDTSGYVLHENGRLYPFGGAPKARVSRYWSGQDRARGVVMLSNKRGGYVLDQTGRLYPFAVGSYSMPASIQGKDLWWRAARGVVLRSDQRSGYILSTSGRVWAFGGAPSRTSTGVSSSASARAITIVTNDAGYWVDHRGVLHAWGAAFGNPTITTLSSGRARGAIGL